MRLEKNNIIIRQALTDDYAILCKWWNDGKVMAHAGFPNGLGTTVEDIASNLSNDSKYTRMRLIIELNNEAIGEMNYRITDLKTAQIGIKICDFSRQEKGIGTICLNMLIDYLFEDIKVDKIVLDTNLKNRRAQHVYEKVGFVKTGESINSWVDQLGEKQSFVLYELKKDWRV